MPHFVIESSKNVTALVAPQKLLAEVHARAESSGLFKKTDIKVRIRTFEHFMFGGENADFLHVFAYIMEGRTTEQKKDLSVNIVKSLKKLLPEVPVVSINIMDFEKTTYCNRTMID